MATPYHRAYDASRSLPVRIGVTLAAVLVHRLGCAVPLPGIDPETLAGLTRSNALAIERISLFALGLTPLLTVYMPAELLRLLVPPFAVWQAQPSNDVRLQRWLRLAALGLAAVQAFGIATALEDMRGVVAEPGWSFRIGTVATLVAATAALSWLADLVTSRGLGNGFWLLLAVPVIARLPSDVAMTLELVRLGSLAPDAARLAAGYLVVGSAALVGLHLARRDAVPAATRFGAWPPLLGQTVLGWIAGGVYALSQVAPPWRGAGAVAYYLLMAALILAFARRTAASAEVFDMRRAPDDGSGRTLDDERMAYLARRKVRLRLAILVAAVQIAICVAGDVLGRMSPLALPGTWLIVIVAVALGILDAARHGADATRET